ncbi:MULTISPECIES: hypothetical protein [Legionella]|uniref:Uncharacterized protein n=1 Tax=Legionella maceachernii TaxID=466 RepID=A0A0W0VV96_9GAMM|nr:hypothetical protein [Legionella maceachernii]KTD24043.1 hypothetical protein Lmac_2916 [Legionella maceachernii]SJZ84750.1 hypothetical protein SAMN02745128_01210 [Legionella maceachernii]SUO99277.1 Uncharacterised protein [Legionella maceachernii]
MAKNKIAKQEEIITPDSFDFMFSDDLPPFDEANMTGAINGLIEASNQQMKIAFELTKLIAGNNNNEEQVFSVYKKAVKIVCENYSLKNLLNELEIS